MARQPGHAGRKRKYKHKKPDNGVHKLIFLSDRGGCCRTALMLASDCPAESSPDMNDIWFESEMNESIFALHRILMEKDERSMNSDGKET
jgi:hypothetical protein